MSSTPPRPDDEEPQPTSAHAVLVSFTPAHRPAPAHPPHAGISTRTPLQPQKYNSTLEDPAHGEQFRDEDLIPAPGRPSDENLIRFTPAREVSAPDGNLIRFTPACAPPPPSRTSETWAVPETPLHAQVRRGWAVGTQDLVPKDARVCARKIFIAIYNEIVGILCGGAAFTKNIYISCGYACMGVWRQGQRRRRLGCGLGTVCASFMMQIYVM